MAYPSEKLLRRLDAILKSEHPEWTTKQRRLAVRNYVQLVFDLRDTAISTLEQEDLDRAKRQEENASRKGRTSTKHEASMAKKEITSKKAATAASKVLRTSTSPKAKTAAGSALAQRLLKSGVGRNKVTQAKAGTAASTVLKSSRSKPAKTSAGSALTQRPNRRKR